MLITLRALRDNQVDSSLIFFLLKLILKLNRSLISSNFYYAFTSSTIMYLFCFWFGPHFRSQVRVIFRSKSVPARTRDWAG